MGNFHQSAFDKCYESSRKLHYECLWDKADYSRETCNKEEQYRFTYCIQNETSICSDPKILQTIYTNCLNGCSEKACNRQIERLNTICSKQ